MARRAKLTRMINIRVTRAFGAKYDRAMRYKLHPATVHRELLEAYIEGRVTIKPKPEIKS